MALERPVLINGAVLSHHEIERITHVCGQQTVIVHYPTATDPVYESLIDANVYSPEAYPQGWRLVSGGE